MTFLKQNQHEVKGDNELKTSMYSLINLHFVSGQQTSLPSSKPSTQKHSYSPHPPHSQPPQAQESKPTSSSPLQTLPSLIPPDLSTGKDPLAALQSTNAHPLAPQDKISLYTQYLSVQAKYSKPPSTTHTTSNPSTPQHQLATLNDTTPPPPPPSTIPTLARQQWALCIKHPSGAPTCCWGRENVRYSRSAEVKGFRVITDKEYGHVSWECQKPKQVKDAAYHKEKMLLCKQEEAGVQLNAEQAD
ncbi:hypothetical protein Tco_1575221 [Tanacetum coccineum]